MVNFRTALNVLALTKRHIPDIMVGVWSIAAWEGITRLFKARKKIKARLAAAAPKIKITKRPKGVVVEKPRKAA